MPFTKSTRTQGQLAVLLPPAAFRGYFLDLDKRLLMRQLAKVEFFLRRIITEIQTTNHADNISELMTAAAGPDLMPP